MCKHVASVRSRDGHLLMVTVTGEPRVGSMGQDDNVVLAGCVDTQQAPEHMGLGV